MQEKQLITDNISELNDIQHFNYRIEEPFQCGHLGDLEKCLVQKRALISVNLYGKVYLGHSVLSGVFYKKGSTVCGEVLV